MSPVEDEAVVYNLLLKHKGKLELVDPRPLCPGLKSLPGMHTWNLMSKTGEIYETYEQVTSSPESVKVSSMLRPHMFPPALDVAKELKLERCMRILPHQQDTGGFFIALIRKLPDASTEDDSAAPQQVPFISNTDKKKLNNAKEDETTAVAEEDAGGEKKRTPMVAPAAKRPEAHLRRESVQICQRRRATVHFEGLAKNKVRLLEVSFIITILTILFFSREFYQIDDAFPVSQVLARNRPGENIKNVYFVSKEIRELTIANGDRMKFINMGVPLFQKAELKDPCCIDVKICQEVNLLTSHKILVMYIFYLKKKEHRHCAKVLQETNRHHQKQGGARRDPRRVHAIVACAQ